MSKILANKSNVDLDYPICRPSLDLDFTQEVLDERITFTRGSTGTRVNRNRLIETVVANQPRFDYDPVTGECKGLLIEESRQNLLQYSEQFDTLPWQVTRASISPNTTLTTAPDGTYNADKLVEDTSKTNSHYLYQYFSTTSGTTYTASIYAKSAEKTRVSLFALGGFTSSTAIFNLTTGRITRQDAGFLSASIQSLPNGWFRCSVSITSNSSVANGSIVIAISNQDSGVTFSGDGTSGIYIWGAQLEAGAFPTSYIPTGASTVTRSADVASMTGTNFSSWFNQSEGTLYAAINNITTRSSITYDGFVSLAGTDVNRNVMRIYTQTSGGGSYQNQFLVGFANSLDGIYTDSFDLVTTGPQRIGRVIFSYKQDNFIYTVNGLPRTTSSTRFKGNIPVCNRLLIFGASRFQPAPSGTISRLTYYPRALQPNQLQSLTA